MNAHIGRRLGLGLAALTLAAAACGSTVPKALLQQQFNGQGLLQPGAVPSAGGSIPGVTVPGLAGSAGSTGQLSGSTGAAGGSGGLGPGVTASTIYIGTVEVRNQSAANSQLGVANANADNPDYRGAYDTAMDDVNAHGGVLGRKLVPVWAEFDTTSSQTISQQGQAACATWTQDHKVFAFLADVQGGSTQACAEQAHVVDIIPAGDSTPESFQQYPHYIETSGMNLVREGIVTVKGLHTQNYYDPGAKLGIVTWDLPNYHEALDRGYGPTLQSYGVSQAIPPAFIHAPQTYNDLGGMNADINNAVLKFSSQGIDHVMIVDGAAGICAGACLGYEFLNQAQSQNYTPRYGFNDYNYADTSVNNLYPASQLHGSVAVVWDDQLSSQDVDKQHPNAARDKCLHLMEAHGVPDSQPNERYVALSACEQVWFLQAAISHLGGVPLNADNFIRAANQIGSSFQSLVAYATYIGPNQHDGESAARNEAFFDDCTCYRYTSGIYRV